MIDLDAPVRLRVTCAPHIEPYLCDEIAALGHVVDAVQPASVDLTGSLRDCMKLNLRLRTAFAVLYPLAEFPCATPDALYESVAAIAWEELIRPDGYLTVDSRGDHPLIHSWMYVNQRVKDAIVDRMEAKAGARPNSGPDRTGLVVNVYWHGEMARVHLNTSGAKLSDRGYRRIPFKAPMQETLAAAVVMASGYRGEVPLVNPMSGSGTLAIEAALIATGRAPGLLRANFSLMHLKDFDEAAWQEARREVARDKRKAPPSRIIATDIDPKAIEAAKRNAATAGVDGLIEWGVCDFADSPVPDPPGIILMNPEYGQRMGEAAKLGETYGRIGDFFKQKCAGYTGYIFTGNRELAKQVGLRASRRIEFYNAKIECRLLKYELYAGTRRKPDSPPPADTLAKDG